MKHSTMLKIASLLSMLLFIIHAADDIARGIEKGTAINLTAIPTFAFWMYGALVLGERLSGRIITLLGSLLALLPPALHMTGNGIGQGSFIDKTGGIFFFAWTLIAIGTTGLFSLILSAHGLWRMKWGKSQGSAG